MLIVLRLHGAARHFLLMTPSRLRQKELIALRSSLLPAYALQWYLICRAPFINREYRTVALLLQSCLPILLPDTPRQHGLHYIELLKKYYIHHWRSHRAIAAGACYFSRAAAIYARAHARQAHAPASFLLRLSAHLLKHAHS